MKAEKAESQDWLDHLIFLMEQDKENLLSIASGLVLAFFLGLLFGKVIL